METAPYDLIIGWKWAKKSQAFLDSVHMEMTLRRDGALYTVPLYDEDHPYNPALAREFEDEIEVQNLKEETALYTYSWGEPVAPVTVSEACSTCDSHSDCTSNRDPREIQEPAVAPNAEPTKQDD